MEKRVLIAVLLSIAVMYGYSFLVTPSPKVKKGLTGHITQKQISTARVTSAQNVRPAPTPVPEISAGVRDVVVETDLYSAVFSTSGGALKKIVLKKYSVGTDPKSPRISLIDETNPGNYSLRTSGIGFPLNPFAVYSVNVDGLLVKKGEKKALEFVTNLETGIQIKKMFVFSGDSYTVGVEQQIMNGGTEKQEGALQLLAKNLYVKDPKETRYDVHGATTFADNSLHVQKLKDLEKEAKNLGGRILWSGFEDKYFLSAAISENGSIAQVQVRQDGGYIENLISSPRLVLASGESVKVSYGLFFGPKDLDILKAQGNRLEEVIDFGWFSAIAKPLLYTLKFFYKYVNNYGIAIIIITVILKVLFYPLTNKSYKSMKEMQKLQPKMEELKEKFKNDRDAMNRAVMELYKTHKVNPMGGCLPMVIQIPVFFALYKALMFSIELRHAPFMLWINDLSAPDALFGVIPNGIPLLGGFPIGPLPLLMGATMVIQQKMTPSNMDPMQAKIFMALPFIFTFMFLNFPSGLVLYWLVNNILTIMQQAYINKALKESS
jgi:YidC/Oxa1 family membrane protein insertase